MSCEPHHSRPSTIFTEQPDVYGDYLSGRSDVPSDLPVENPHDSPLRRAAVEQAPLGHAVVLTGPADDGSCADSNAR